jgi:hypothetical protein
MLTEMPMYYAGSGFHWGLLIVGGIIYFLWTKGVFSGRGFGNGGRWGGPGGPSGYGSGPGGGYAPAQPVEHASYGAGQGSSADPRAMFEEWHRQAHASGVEHGHHAAPVAPSSPAAPATGATPEGEQPQSGTSV